MFKYGTYSGKWWTVNPTGIFQDEKSAVEGILTVEDANTIQLEVVCPVNHSNSKDPWYYPVVWGCDHQKKWFTLFELQLIELKPGTSSKFSVKYLLPDVHLKSMDEPFTNTCIVDYPYLRNWALDSRILYSENGGLISWNIDPSQKESMVVANLEDGKRIDIYTCVQDTFSPYKVNIEQSTKVCFGIPQRGTVNQYLRLITEFNGFLSLALLSSQHPSRIEFQQYKRNYSTELIMGYKKSAIPSYGGLIWFEKLRDKVPSMIEHWHDNYDLIAPLNNHLLHSISWDNFEPPDYLLVAIALEGFSKRFNKKGNTFREHIQALLEYYKDVDVVKKCNIDPEVLVQTRNKYAHLGLDSSDRGKEAKGFELFRLTQKSKVLLSCCLLNELGLTIDEINMCCNRSIMRDVANEISRVEKTVSKA